MTRDKRAAFQTLYTCLKTVALLAAPFAPFISDRIYRDLTHNEEGSVHLAEFPAYDAALVDEELERRMELAQRASSMVLALRRKVNIKVRQPLQKMMIPVLDAAVQRRLEAVESLILNEVNVKEVEYLHETTGIITKRIKPSFKTLGPKYGKQMKAIAAAVAEFSQEDIAAIEALGSTGGAATYDLAIAGGEVLPVERADFEITSEDMPGWLVATEGTLTIALDIEVTPELRAEGMARELVNRIQNLRKEQGFEVTDKIRVVVEANPETDEAVSRFADYIAYLGVNADPAEVNHRYEQALGNYSIMLPGALELVQALAARYPLYIVTNGLHTAQTGRFEKSPIKPYISGLFISQDMDCQKPEREFFEKVFAAIGLSDRREVVMVGDSLTSDIRGGINAGIDTVWYNPGHLPRDPDCLPTVEAHTMEEIAEYLLQ